MHMKFEIEIPKQTWLMLRKPCRLQTDGRTDRRTDGQTDKVNPVYPPSNFVGRGYNYSALAMELLQSCTKPATGHPRSMFLAPGDYYNKHGLTLIPAWISNHMPCEVWDEFTESIHKFQQLHSWNLGMFK